MEMDFELILESLRDIAFDKSFPGAIQSVDHQGTLIEACRQVEAYKKWSDDASEEQTGTLVNS